MTAMDNWLRRVAVITALVEKAGPVTFGRTALMKCLYFLQTARGVPLDYDFSLYTYGPFDSDALGDLGLAERRGYVQSELRTFRGGQGYELHAAGGIAALGEHAAAFLDRYQDDIDWVVREFGRRSALDLEMASTLVYIDREVAEGGGLLRLDELAKNVHEMKPHLALESIAREARSLKDKGLLKATD